MNILQKLSACENKKISWDPFQLTHKFAVLLGLLWVSSFHVPSLSTFRSVRVIFREFSLDNENTQGIKKELRRSRDPGKTDEGEPAIFYSIESLPLASALSELTNGFRTNSSFSPLPIQSRELSSFSFAFLPSSSFLSDFLRSTLRRQ